MSPPTPEPLRPWQRLRGWRSIPLLLRPDGLWDGQAAWPGFDAWCRDHPGQRCVLWLAAPLLHELVCDPALPLADDRAALDWARPLLQHYHGEAAAGWALAAWQQGAVRGVSVLHGMALQSLRATAQDHGVRMLAVRPWWSLALRLAVQRQPALRRGAALLLVLEAERVVALALRNGRLQSLQVRRLDEATPEALARWVRDHADGATPWALGYGLRGPAPAGVQAPEPLDAPAPPPPWLGAAS